MCLVSTEATESFGPAGWHWLYSISSGFGIVFHVVIALLLQASFCLFCLTVGLTLRCNPISYCWQKCLNNSQRAETMFTVVHMQCVLSNDYSCTPWIVSPDYKINYRKQVWSDQRLFLILSPSHSTHLPSIGELPPAEQCPVFRSNHGRVSVWDRWGQHHWDRLRWRQSDSQRHQDGAEEGHRHHQRRHPPHRPGARPRLR